ncbi:uncharacterized protein EI90DRAFT_2912531 [Cantharellus anzutake]|uniref:uncharacterized protein n=1 Tax=Cantharellus anzutake TaxID=1750568 RepID=UPI001906B4AA|nr:uncharacterized protein EI90DRAFT_2912531 [Cantharellus anzutake]KAF8335898.1 hypothetical protein EI90DRAFT_2912531 [Cantharellus anzutake]
MTKYNLSLDNPSPLLSYSPQTQWISIASKNDSSLYENTASATSQVGAEVSFTFRGTGVWIYGTKGEAHGYYNVTLDNTTQSFDGYSDTEEYQQVLFGANNLGLASHTVRIVNAGPLRGGDSNRVWLNIDWLTWETVFVGPGGPYGAEVFNATFNETHRRFFYIPPDAWSQRAYIDNVSINGTASYTTSSDASMQFVFDGDAVGLYGSLDGSFSANVDKGDFKSLTSTYNGSAYQQLLFYAENLGGGTHTLSIENSPQSTSTAKSTLAVDFARTWTARGGSSSNEPAK